MFPILRKRRIAEVIDFDDVLSDLPYDDDAASTELSRPAQRDLTVGITVSELSELEARALCAREDIPVFWPRALGANRRG